MIDSPERADPRGRTQRYQATKGRLAGERSIVDETTQGSLFDETDLAQELDRANTGAPNDPQEEDR